MDYLKRTWAEIDLDAIKNNIIQIKSRLDPNTKILGVVKADAYGHGDVQVAKTLEENGVSWFGVATMEEGIVLRKSGINGDILVFGITPPENSDDLIKYNISQAIYSLSYANKLSDNIGDNSKKLKAHLALDTGMGRIGLNTFEPESCVSEAKQILQISKFNFTGIFTHFAASDEYQENSIDYTFSQFKRFTFICNKLTEYGICPAIRHCCNSAGTLSYPEMHLDMVRPGIIIYGLKPSADFKAFDNFKPAMQVKSKIILIKQVESGKSISYGRIYTTVNKSLIATIPIGYADGYPRLLSNKGTILVNGQLAPIVGRICMDQCMIDISGISGVNEGDTVTIFGKNKNGEINISVDELARSVGSINYELVCQISKRVPRIYYKNGAIVEISRYKNIEY
jgi:alanine racemase